MPAEYAETRKIVFPEWPGRYDGLPTETSWKKSDKMSKTMGRAGFGGWQDVTESADRFSHAAMLVARRIPNARP